MTMVRFATLCDCCGARSEEYSAWPECAECMEDLCPNCYVPGSLSEGEGERRDRVMCHTCSVEVTA
jgi:hypothetical protein